MTAVEAEHEGDGWLDREDDEGAAAGHQRELGDPEHPAAVDGIGDRTGAEREDQDRDQLEQRQRGLGFAPVAECAYSRRLCRLRRLDFDDEGLFAVRCG